MQSKYCIQKTVGQFPRVELVPGLVFFFLVQRRLKEIPASSVHIGGNPKLNLEREQDSGTNLIMLELCTNKIAATDNGCKVQTCSPLQVRMFFQQELGNLEGIRVIRKVTLSLGLLFTPLSLVSVVSAK
jgi:hypothetical protein